MVILSWLLHVVLLRSSLLEIHPATLEHFDEGLVVVDDGTVLNHARVSVHG